MNDWINLGELKGEPLPAIVVYPGDRVLVSLHAQLNQQEAHELQEKLRERFPGATFTLLTGAAQIAVMRGEVGEPPEHRGARGEMPTGEDFLNRYATSELLSTEHPGRRGPLRWQRDRALREYRAAQQRIGVLERELAENGAHFDAMRQEYCREIDQLKVDKEAAKATEDRLRAENRELWRRLDLAAHQVHDVIGRRIILDNPSHEDHRKVTRERNLARAQRDRLITVIRNHINGFCGRSTTHLHDVVDEIEREIKSMRSDG
jgi:hypothetical protein